MDFLCRISIMRDSIYLTELLNFLSRPLLSNWPTNYIVCSCNNTFWGTLLPHIHTLATTQAEHVWQVWHGLSTPPYPFATSFLFPRSWTFDIIMDHDNIFLAVCFQPTEFQFSAQLSKLLSFAGVPRKSGRWHSVVWKEYYLLYGCPKHWFQSSFLSLMFD